jgi:nucleotide-binding universal stress UspA family protein
MPSTDIERILLPTDYSEEARTALAYATRLALVHHARLVVLHVVATLGPERLTYGEAVSQRQPEGYQRRLWAEFHRQVPLPPCLEDVELVLREGDPAEAIVHTAAERGCNLIVMAGHERSGFGRWWFRGTAEKVLGRAACPVLIVKEAGTPKQTDPDGGTDLHPHCLSQRLGRRRHVDG